MMYYDAEMRRSCKERARELLHRSFWPSMLAALICMVPVGAAAVCYELAMPQSLDNPIEVFHVWIPAWIIYTLVDIFLLSPIVMGCYLYFVRRVRTLNGKEEPSVFELFSCFESLPKYFIAVKLSLVLYLYNILWSLLLIPALFVTIFAFMTHEGFGLLALVVVMLPLLLFVSAKTTSYTAAYVLLADHPDMGVFAAAYRGAQRFKDRIWELFVFEISFFWWGVLSLLTFGIVGVYYNAYLMTAFILYVDAIDPERLSHRENDGFQPPIL